MEFLKCKAVIALVVMVLGVSYVSASENTMVSTHTQDDGVNVMVNA